MSGGIDGPPGRIILLDCALSIKAFLALDPHPPRAFDELRAAEGWTTGR
jgi:hypothetical protein